MLLFIVDYVRLALGVERCLLFSVTQEGRNNWIPWYFFSFGIDVNHLLIFEIVMSYSLFEVRKMLLEALEFLAFATNQLGNVEK